MQGWIQHAKQNRVGSVFIDVFDWYRECTVPVAY
jgi:hypothetical protein